MPVDAQSVQQHYAFASDFVQMLKVLQKIAFAFDYARLDAQSVTQCARGLLKDDSLFAAHHLCLSRY